MKSEIDLNLLKVLPLLYRHKKIKTVAKILGKSEASVSKYLARLREQLNDDLFTLDPNNGYEPSQFILDILPEIESGLSNLELTLNRHEFDKSAYNNEIVIAIPQLSQYYIGHELLKRVMSEFPNAPVSIVGWSDSTPTKMQENQIDIAIQMFSSQLPKTIYQQVIGRFGLAIVVPETMRGISKQQAFKLPFIMAQAKGWNETIGYDQLLQELVGRELNVVAKVDNITCILNSVIALKGATIMAVSNKPIPGFYVIPLDIPAHKLPASCVMIKQQHRQNGLHQALTNIVVSLYGESRPV